MNKFIILNIKLIKIGDGYVKAEEIKSALGHSSDIENIINASKDRSGKIKYEEFLRLMKQS